jgi:hypothetical protein
LILESFIYYFSNLNKNLINHLKALILFIGSLNAKEDEKESFACPGDGKWPHDTQCGRYLTII